MDGLTIRTMCSEKGLMIPLRMPVIALAVLLSAAIEGEAHAQGASAPFPAGKPVSIYVGTAAGGANDAVMRLVARHIGKYLPGNPTVLLKSLPGAGGQRVAAYLYGVAPRDGTEFGTF